MLRLRIARRDEYKSQTIMKFSDHKDKNSKKRNNFFLKDFIFNYLSLNLNAGFIVFYGCILSLNLYNRKELLVDNFSFLINISSN